MSQTHTKLTPVGLRFMLAFVMLVIVGAAVTGFIYSYRQLDTYAIEVSHKKADDTASSNSLQVLQTTKTELAANQQAISRAQSITATGELPQFVAIQDVKAYAARNDLALQSIDFVTSASQTPTATSSTTTTTPTQAVPTGAQSVDLSISFVGEVNYKDYLQFLSDIEHNIPKMQVDGIKLSKGSSVGTVNAGPLIIHTYIN